MEQPKPELVVLLGAGASAGSGGPSTSDITSHVRELGFPQCVLPGVAYATAEGMVVPPSQRIPIVPVIFRNLSPNGASANFEQLLHAVETLESYAASYEDFSPDRDASLILTAFTQPTERARHLINYGLLTNARTELISEIARFVDRATTGRTGTDVSLARTRVGKFFEKLAETYKVSCFSLNYDTTVESALPWADGFVTDGKSADQIFSQAAFSRSVADGDANVLCHLHGSVLFGYREKDGQIAKYATPSEACASYRFAGAAKTNSGGEYLSTGAIISGVRKLDKMNTTPYGYFYSAMINALVRSPRVLIIGYGFSDPHINYWLEQHASLHDADRRAGLITLIGADKMTGTVPEIVAPLAKSLGCPPTEFKANRTEQETVLRAPTAVLVPTGFPLRDNIVVDEVVSFFSG